MGQLDNLKGSKQDGHSLRIIAKTFLAGGEKQEYTSNMQYGSQYVPEPIRTINLVKP